MCRPKGARDSSPYKTERIPSSGSPRRQSRKEEAPHDDEARQHNTKSVARARYIFSLTTLTSSSFSAASAVSWLNLGEKASRAVAAAYFRGRRTHNPYFI